VLAGVAPAPHVAGRLAAEADRHAPDQLPGAVEQQAALRSRRALAGERVEQLGLALGPDPRHRPQLPRRRRLAQLAGRPDAERPRDLERAGGPEPEVAAQADELGRELALELGELADLARLHELPQPALDPRSDPAQPAHLSGPHQPGDGNRRAADRLGRPAIGARLVRVRVGQVEQRRERLQAVGDPGVVHRGSVSGEAGALISGA
jgi:hypothetical protein